MLSPNEKTLSQQQAREMLSNLLAAFEHLEVATPNLTFDGFKTLIAVALTNWDVGQSRLPDVSKVSILLNKSLSSGSRLIGMISDSKGLALVEGRSGLSGTRSDALALTSQGNELLSSFLKVLTGREIEPLIAQNFDDIVARKNAVTENIEEDAAIFLKMASYDKEAITMVVSPEADAISQTIRDWCDTYLSNIPNITTENGFAIFKFSSISDLVYFKAHWCWR